MPPGADPGQHDDVIERHDLTTVFLRRLELNGIVESSINSLFSGWLCIGKVRYRRSPIPA
jgi:hypothetical protein